MIIYMQDKNGCGREKTCVELAPPIIIFCFLPENYG